MCGKDRGRKRKTGIQRFVRCALSLWPKAENRFQVDNGRILRNGALVVECKIAPFVFFGSPPRKLRFSQRALANIPLDSRGHEVFIQKERDLG